MKKILLSFLSFFSFLSVILAQNPALNFDGVNDHISTSYLGISGSAARSIEAWIRTTSNSSPTSGGRQQVIVDYGTFATGQRFTLNLLNNSVRIEISGGGLTGTIPVNDGQWHHVAVVYNPAATNPYKLYVDSVLDVQGIIPVSINTVTSVGLMIGSRIDTLNRFTGDIDEVKMFNYARSLSNIISEMYGEYCTLPSGLVAYYKLNEGTPADSNLTHTTATDYSLGLHNGTLNNFNLYGTSSNYIVGRVVSGANSDTTYSLASCDAVLSPSGSFSMDSSGTYYDTITNSLGCDSFISINFSLLTPGMHSSSVFACDSFSTLSGQLITSSGTYYDTLVASTSCDSILVYNVTIGSSHFYDTLVRCDSFVSPTTTYYTSGNYTEYFVSSMGCDSTVSYSLTLTAALYSSGSITFCDSAYVYGNWYYSNDTLVQTYTASSGCDSTHTLFLNISSGSSQFLSLSACDSFVFAGTTYYSSTSDTFTYVNINHCDSIIVLNININYSSDNSIILPAQCDSVFAGGTWYNHSGTFTSNYLNVHGCDSTVHFVVTVNQSSQETIDVLACDSAFVLGSWYHNNATVIDSNYSTSGCDSVTTYNIFITQINDSFYVNPIVSYTVYETHPDATFSWIDCTNHTLLSGETANVLYPTYNSTYACIIDLNGCSDTTACMLVEPVGIKGISKGEIHIYPNPVNNGVLVIDSKTELKQVMLFNVTGSCVFVQNYSLLNRQTINLPSNIAAGLYHVWVTTQDGIFQDNIEIK